MNKLTVKQREILDAIETFKEEKSYSPTIRELADIFSITNKAIADHLQALKSKGRLTWEPKQMRTLRVLPEKK